MSGITTPDDKTVVFTLTRPDATFLHLMAINFGFVVPKEEIEKAGADWGKKPVGTGAFKFVEWVPGQRIVLARNPDYPPPRRTLSRQAHLRIRPGPDGGGAATGQGRGRHRR